MKLDRYTQKAQEAILTAQQLASSAKSPVLDVEPVSYTHLTLPTTKAWGWWGGGGGG